MHTSHIGPPGWRRMVVFTAVLGAILGPRPVAGLQDRSTGDDLEYAVEDVFHVWGGPFRMGGDDALPLVLVLGATAGVGVMDEEVQDWTGDHPESLPVRMTKPFRTGEPLQSVGRTYMLQGLSAALYLAGHVVGSQGLRDAGVGCAAANVATTLPRTLLSRLPGRMRPLGGLGAYDFEPFALDDWNRRSLPGGHVANLAACVGFWSNRFELGLLEPALDLLMLTVGFGRIVDEAHWASDTVLGIAWGWAVGRRVAHRQLGRLDAPPGVATNGLGIVWRIPM